MKLNKKLFKMFLLLIFFSVLTPFTPAEGAVTMKDYCITPPFVSQTIPPNVLIVLDNSGSMCGQAYAGNYDSTKFTQGYYGYFDASKNYIYSGSGRWEVTTDAMNTGTVSKPIANGSFLNWATMRRVEVAKKLLIGGKGNPRSWNGSVTVKLDGETGCDRDFQKDYDTTGENVIYPFEGKYRFSRDGGNLNIIPLATNFITYPNGNVSVPSGWTVSGAGSAYEAVDESSSDGDATYIQNNNTTNPVLLDYDYTQSKPMGNITVTVKVRAKRASGTATRRIVGVLRIDGVNYESSSSSISGNYNTYSFTWTSNPATGLPWDWSEIKSAGIGTLEAFGVKANSTYTSDYPRVTQIYLDIAMDNPDGGPFNTIIDQGNVNATGIIDNLTGDVRFGLAYYASSNEGGKINTDVAFNTANSMITSIENMIPSGWTPLGETLYELTRYFRQDDPFYSNSPADYQTGLNYDPYYYKFSTLDATLSDKYVPCAKSFVLFLTDGESTKDENMQGSSTAAPYSACTLTNIKACSGYGGAPNNPNPRFAGTSIGTTYVDNGTDYLIDAAYWMRTNDMRPGSCTSVPTTFDKCIPGNQNINLYSVYMFGKGSTLLKDAAIYGGFNDLDGNNKPDCTTTPDECYRDTNGNGVVDSTDDPITYYEGEDGYELQNSITNAIADILRRVTSGTAASVLASGEGSGANLIQAVFYPRRKFNNGPSFDEIDWTGRITNLWYYVDPLFKTSNIREEDGDRILNLKATTAGTTHDYVLSLYFDKASAKAKAHRWEDPLGNGVIDTQLLPDIEFEALGNLWEAGTLLWKRDVTTAAGKRKIYTTINGSSLLAGNFSSNTLNGDANNSAALAPYLNVAAADAPNLIDWVQGVDVSGYRSRTVKVESIDPIARVWKLGDIVNSTPKIASWTALNTYDKVYGDLTYGIPNQLGDPADATHFITTADYKKRGMVFTGGNDGMLHAFKLGTLELQWTGQGATEKARLVNPDTGDVCKAGDAVPCGKEIWAFIPKNALPYLQYMADTKYCHLYSVDLTPFIFDASIDGAPDDARTVSSWKTILIGGMRFGGACKKSTDTCTTANCVKTPIADPGDATKGGLGYSSYFALDITDQNNPKLLWEFSDPELGFATSGPSIVRINGKTAGVSDKLTNGNWFVIFGSGPTGPISTGDHQFMGQSDQNLKLFILNLAKPVADAWTVNTNYWVKDTGISNAFAGSLGNSSLDTDGSDYQDEIVYVPYIQKCTATTAAPSPFSSNNICAVNTWTNGGMGRLSTKRDANPSNWTWSTFIDNIGPVTSAVGKIIDQTNSNLWVYFGTGRYYFTQTTVDDSGGQRFLFGVKDPCFTSTGYDLTCTTPASLVSSPFSGLTDVTDIANVPTTSVANGTTFKGWYLALDPSGTYTYAPDPATNFSAERMITDPLASIGQGIVYFTTYKPSNDICTFGGKSFIWAMQYNTGGIPALLSGKALIQVSTGAIEQKDLATAFTAGGGRKSAAMEGKPPEAQGLSIIAGPPPTRKVIHVKER